ncbi:uncharacterized protein EV420DRAFT_670250 [Desarmillaria tabescens]|uniref:Uncharacterized protein n=1 Tax=Armillaria tabescens TaxID=1929756 RepID=A0AA39NK58_ARMTA|nr:uncharacterized protein EV420DRAFT_670250 [Desarmillaria tabescens]KAK0467167.1 hypothetical protein EV420DRAFT_670250 [Desarmillaria tabescens]
MSSSQNSTLSDTAYDEVTAYWDCIAQSDRNPDVEGYAVRLSTYIANVCLAILMTWSRENVKASVYVILMQAYTVFLATFISLWRKKLSIADAHFVFTITISPLSLYLVYSTFRLVMRKSTGLYERLGDSKRWTAIWSTLMLVIWIVLECIIYVAPDHVFEGERCTTASFEGWLFYRLLTGLVVFEFASFFIPVLLFMYLLYTLRHCKDIYREYKWRQGRVIKWRFFRILQIPWNFVRILAVSNYVVVFRSHRWLVFFAGFHSLSYYGRAIWVSGYPDMEELYDELVHALHSDEPDYQYTVKPEDDFDPLGFGQILAATIAIEPIYEVVKLTFRRRWDVWEAIKHYPGSVWSGIVFILTGHQIRGRKF